MKIRNKLYVSVGIIFLGFFAITITSIIIFNDIERINQVVQNGQQLIH